jgi:hypothetical protein
MKENPRILRVVVHHNKGVPLPTHISHTRWVNKVHMEQLAWMLSHHIGERRVRRGYHLGSREELSPREKPKLHLDRSPNTFHRLK